MRAPRRFVANEDGTVMIIGAAAMFIILTLTVIILDWRMVRNEDRALQNAVDFAAISGAADIERAEAAALATLEANGIDLSTMSSSSGGAEGRPRGGASVVEVEVRHGRFDDAADTLAEDRFVEGERPFNAVRVTVGQYASRRLAENMLGPAWLERSATARVAAEVAASVGSRLARLEGGVANELLSAATGSTVELSVMDYEALVAGKVSLLGFLDAVATEAAFAGGTYEELLKTDIRMPALLRALSAASTDPAGARAADALARRLASDRAGLPLDKLFHLGSAGREAIGVYALSIDANLSLYDVVAAAALTIGAGRPLELDLAAAAGDLAEVSARVVIGEPPQDFAWFMVREDGELIRTAQMRLAVQAVVGGKGPLKDISISLPLHFQAAYAEASIEDVACGGFMASRLDAVDIAARPGVVDAWLGDVDPSAFADFGRPPVPAKATIIDAPALTVMARSHVHVGDAVPRRLRFTAEEIERGVVKTVSTRNFLSTLLGDLVADSELDVRAGPLNIGLPHILKAALASSLRAVGDSLDVAIRGVLRAAGLGLGEADVELLGGRCGRAALVQ
ncbi:MAG: hypothetical protein GC152_01875 [Alphaproteobacteria bacterium]|nr:hypothetical protein [Alphaproteobacteria bacterium]